MTTTTSTFVDAGTIARINREHERAVANFVWHQNELAKLSAANNAGGDTAGLNNLAGALNHLARAQAALETFAEVASYAVSEQQHVPLEQVLLKILDRDPNDTWSGRTNDVRRAHGDGVREAVHRINRL